MCRPANEQSNSVIHLGATTTQLQPLSLIIVSSLTRMKDFALCAYTGYTQKNGAVSKVNKNKSHHYFVYAHIIDTNQEIFDQWHTQCA
jgi:hypothetical protein